MPAKHVGQLCRRCNALEAALTVRSEPLCRDCFSKYVHSKVIKRMEAFRTRHISEGQERKLLLPVSFGVSSVTLLLILDKHLRIQRQRTGRTGFSLHILHIKSPDNLDFSSQFTALRELYPDHDYSTVDLHDLFESTDFLDAMLRQIPSATSISDILTILRTRLMVKVAKAHGCEGILLGHSTTALAERILSTTALGRGFSLSWEVLDGLSPYGIAIYHPMRDVLKKELVAHVEVVEPSLKDMIDKTAFVGTVAPPSKKDTTIEGLMRGYFEEVEEGYPNIVNNVVRTATKLEIPAAKEGDVICQLCALPVSMDKLGIAGWGG